MKKAILQNILSSLEKLRRTRILWYNRKGKGKTSAGVSMIKVMFVCHGNICRSPMAEYIFADLVRRADRDGDILVSSTAASREEIGSDIYPPAKRELLAHGIPCPPRAARQITDREIGEYDYILCMDERNRRYLARMSSLALDKVRLLGDYGLNGKEIEDPWYTGRFSVVYEEIARACDAFLKTIIQEV